MNLTRRGFLTRLGIGVVTAPAVLRSIGTDQPPNTAPAAYDPLREVHHTTAGDITTEQVIQAARQVRAHHPMTFYLASDNDLDPIRIRTIAGELASAQARHTEQIPLDTIFGA